MQMICERVDEMIKKLKEADNVIIVGAGKHFFNLNCMLNNSGIDVKEVFDNNEEIVGEKFNDVLVRTPYKASDGTLYVISAKSDKVAEQFKKQLEELGISEKAIIRQPHIKSDPVVDISDEEKVKDALDELYYERFGKMINWEKPSTYNEIINIEKVYNRDDRKRMLADKFMVREYVKKKIGEEHLIKLLGYWQRFEDIDFDSLPDQFVLKTNNGSGRNIIVISKDEMNIEQSKEKLNAWLCSDYWKGLYELQYKDIAPVIICEEYLPGIADEKTEYQFFCFHGEPKYIWCIRGSHKPGCKAAFYDVEWNKQEFCFGYPIDEKDEEKPLHLKEMLSISEKLSGDFKHVRVDLYEMPDGRILFGELSFSSWGGMKHFVPEKYDELFGKLILKNGGN